jgi:CIC family chloride channel protein
LDLLNNRTKRLLFDSVLLGVVGAFSAQIFIFLLKIAQKLLLVGLAGYRPPGLPDEGGILQEVIGSHGLWLIPIATTLGGLISGILVYSFAPEAEGHGTDTAVKSFHRAAGFIRARVPFLKMVASAITIGSGGSAGREGPIALISSGIGSIYAKVANRSEDERRLLVLIGMAAGLSAIFRSPIGTALFAVEVLYAGIEFEAAALLFTMLSSVIAYAINGLFVGWEPLFRVSEMSVPSFPEYGWYIILGLVSGLAATMLPIVFYGLRDAFKKIPIPDHFKPAIGGLGVGIIALFLPQVLGGGYGWIQEAIDGRIAISLLIILVFVKMIVFSLTVSSGGSGGVFAPSLFVGAMLGGFLAHVFHLHPAAFVVVGMAALFGGAARVPFATLIMVTEMTNGYSLLAPAALAVLISFVVQGALARRVKYKSLYEAQVPGRADSPAHHVEHLRIALDLLQRRRIPTQAEVGHLDLVALLEQKIPVDLTGGKMLMIGSLFKDSGCIGKTIQSSCLTKGDKETEIVAILREGELILPNKDIFLEEKDQLLVITSSEMSEQLKKHISFS